MLKASALISEKSSARANAEKRYEIVYAAVLFICGTLMLLIPILGMRIADGGLVMAAGWMLLVALAFSLLRPLIFNRGIADSVMCILTAMLYGIVGWGVSDATIGAMNDYRLMLCLVFFFSGLSRIINFAGIISKATLPLLLVCGAAETGAAVMLFAGWPDGRAAMIYWLIGMTTLVLAFECISEAAILNVNSRYYKEVNSYEKGR